jgi:hypothetical protein
MSEPDQATAAATDRAKQFKDATDKVRERSDAAAKALAALGTAGLTAVGISKFSDVFPLPDGELPVVVIVLLGFLLMVGVLVGLTYLLLNANRPFVPATDIQGASAAELEEIEKIYDRVAKQYGAPSLRAYEARGQRLQRIADRKADATEAAPLLAKAARIRAETESAQARVALLVSRMRMNGALKGRGAKLCAIVFPVGLLMFGIGSDHLDSKRSAEVAAYKACADAATAGVKNLPPICNGVVAKAPEPTAAAKRRDALQAAYTACVDTAVEQAEPLRMCDGIKARLEAAAK